MVIPSYDLFSKPRHLRQKAPGNTEDSQPDLFSIHPLSGCERLLADIVTTAIRSLDLKYPEVTDEQRELLAKARQRLSDE
jgi:hypothetical protein